MPRVKGVATEVFRSGVRKKFLEEHTSDEMLELVGHDQRRMEQWVKNMLSQSKGPQKVLDVLYNDGSAHEFLKLLQSIEGNGPGARDFETLREEKMRSLVALDNRDDNGQPGRYYVGNLYTKEGEPTTHKLTLTAAGKMQLFLNGNGALEITLRDVVGKRWIQQLVVMEARERELRIEYNAELSEKRQLSTDQYHCMLTTMTDNGMESGSAKAVLRGSARDMHKAILPGFKSGRDAVLNVEGKVRVRGMTEGRDLSSREADRGCAWVCTAIRACVCLRA